MKNNFYLFILDKKKEISNIFSLILIFGGLKSLVYFAPLSLSSLLNSEITFGKFEYSFNLGQSLTGVFALGLASAYAYFVFRNNRLELKPIFHLHFILLISLLILCILISPSLIDNLYFGAIVTAIALADQIFISGVLKLSDKYNKSVIVDSFIYIILTFIVLLMYVKMIDFSFRIWFSSILVSLLCTSLFYHSRKLTGLKKLKLKHFLELYSFAGLILISAPLVVLISASTRLYLEWFINFESVGVYSLYFRLASFSLIFYRIITILLHKNIFIDKHKELDYYYSLIIIGIFIFNIALYFTLPLIFNSFNIFENFNFKGNKGIIICCLFQVSFWINSALFESIMHRENLVVKFIILLLILLSILFIGLTFMNKLNFTSIESIIWFNSFIIFLLFLGQLFIISKKGIYYKKSLIVHLVIGALFLPTIYLII